MLRMNATVWSVLVVHYGIRVISCIFVVLEVAYCGRIYKSMLSKYGGRGEQGIKISSQINRVNNFNPLKTKRRLLYLKTQFVPRSKHFSSRL